MRIDWKITKILTKYEKTTLLHGESRYIVQITKIKTQKEESFGNQKNDNERREREQNRTVAASIWVATQVFFIIIITITPILSINSCGNGTMSVVHRRITAPASGLADWRFDLSSRREYICGNDRSKSLRRHSSHVRNLLWM